MAYKLLDMAQARCDGLMGAHLPPPLRAGIPFVDGQQRAPTGRTPSARVSAA